MTGFNAGPAGITMDDKLMSLSRGWFVVYKDGIVCTENETEWGDVRKGEIKILGIKWLEKYWTISGKTAYLQFKSGSVVFSPSGISSDINCEERCIGYYEGNLKVIYRVNERTGRMIQEVREPSNG